MPQRLYYSFSGSVAKEEDTNIVIIDEFKLFKTNVLGCNLYTIESRIGTEQFNDFSEFLEM